MENWHFLIRLIIKVLYFLIKLCIGFILGIAVNILMLFIVAFLSELIKKLIRILPDGYHYSNYLDVLWFALYILVFQWIYVIPLMLYLFSKGQWGLAFGTFLGALGSGLIITAAVLNAG